LKRHGSLPQSIRRVAAQGLGKGNVRPAIRWTLQLRCLVGSNAEVAAKMMYFRVQAG
jgi:hypothetical protein